MGKRKVSLLQAWRMAENGIYKRPAKFNCVRCSCESQSKRGQYAKLCGLCQMELTSGKTWENVGKRNVNYVGQRKETTSSA